MNSALLQGGLGAGLLEFLLGGLGVGLVGAFEHRFGGAFDEGLGFGQAQARLHFAHDFDDRDLLVGGGRFQDDVERGLRLGGRSSGASGGGAGGGDSDGRGGGDAPRGFEFLHEIRGFDHGQFAQL